jgi:hypothetical protein
LAHCDRRLTGKHFPPCVPDGQTQWYDPSVFMHIPEHMDLSSHSLTSAERKKQMFAENNENQMIFGMIIITNAKFLVEVKKKNQMMISK